MRVDDRPIAGRMGIEWCVMIYQFSPGLIDSFCYIDDLLGEIRAVACQFDPDIIIRDLRVEARRHSHPDHFNGWAYALMRSQRGIVTSYHRDGLIRLQIGHQCEDENIIRLYAHELRHIGQFHRGRERYGRMTDLLSRADSEHDADEFEQRVMNEFL